MRHLRYLSCIALALHVFGCTDNQTPTVDLPSRMDAEAVDTDASTQGDDMTVESPDVGGTTDQAFIPSSSPIPTNCGHDVASTRYQQGHQHVTCSVYDNGRRNARSCHAVRCSAA